MPPPKEYHVLRKLGRVEKVSKVQYYKRALPDPGTEVFARTPTTIYQLTNYNLGPYGDCLLPCTSQGR